MSQKHVDFILKTLGEEEDQGGSVLKDYDIPGPDVQAIPDSFDFLPEEVYDPVSDIETASQGCGVHYMESTPRKCEVVGNNGRFLFCFKLTEI